MSINIKPPYEREIKLDIALKLSVCLHLIYFSCISSFMTSFKKGHFSQQKLQVFARGVITHKWPFLSCNHFFSTKSSRLCFFYLCKCEDYTSRSWYLFTKSISKLILLIIYLKTCIRSHTNILKHRHVYAQIVFPGSPCLTQDINY